MQCLTCGKRVAKNQAVCPNCGAMVDPAALGTFGEPAGMELRLPQTGEPLRQESIEERQLEELGEEPVTGPRPERESAPPRPPSWIRFLIPLAFILVPLLNLLWDSSPFQTGGDQPVLRQAVFCEGIRNGRPVNPKEAFSIREDRQLVLYSLWRGERENHAYLLRWYAPDGQRQGMPKANTRYGSARDAFFTLTVLPLEPGLALGNWRVEILLDGAVKAQRSFELRE